MLASEPVAEIIENYHREQKQQQQLQQQQVSAGAMLPPDIFVKLQFGDDLQVGFVSVIVIYLWISYVIYLPGTYYKPA